MADSKLKKALAADALVEVRVLSDCQFGLCGEVASIPAALVAEAKARVLVDDDPAAVAYAKANLIKSAE
jgi:hypothetical protein